METVDSILRDKDASRNFIFDEIVTYERKRQIFILYLCDFSANGIFIADISANQLSFNADACHIIC